MNSKQRIVLTRCLAAYILLFLLQRWLNYSTPWGMLGPPLFNLGPDITYWAFWLSHIADVIVYNRAGALIFDSLLFASCLLLILFPLKRKWIIAFSLLLVLYCLVFNTLALRHTVTVYGLMVVLLPFWFADGEKFNLAWEGMRYYACFVYFAAFVWKTCIGNSFYYWQQGTGSFKSNLAEYLYHNPESLMSHIYRVFLRHDWALNTGHIFIVVLEGLMGIGFFTKKWDRVLFWLPVIIHITTYFFADVFIFELLVLNFAFLRPAQLESIGQKFPILIYPNPHAQKNNTKGVSSAQ